MKKKGGDLICMRPDRIVEARFKLTKRQNDIMDMVFATIKDDDNLIYEIDINKYAKLYNIQDKSNIYGDLKKTIKTFEGKGFAITEKISDKKETRIYFSWFSSIEYIDGQCKIKIELGQKLKKILIEVKRAAFYNIQYTLNFKSVYSKRLYYYLKLYEDTGERLDNIDILKGKLECPKSYKNYADFNRYVLKPAYEEINGSSDISFEYKKKYTGKKVTHIEFSIKSNKKSNKTIEVPVNQAEDEAAVTVAEESIENISIIQQVQAIFKENVEPLEVKKILDAAKGDIEVIKNKYRIAQETENIKSIVAWMIKAIKEDWQMPQNKTKKSNFSDYEGQRQYDPKKLENKLLGWDKKGYEEDNEDKEKSINKDYDMDTIVSQLKKLSELKVSGILTEEEFENKKRILLNKIR